MKFVNIRWSLLHLAGGRWHRKLRCVASQAQVPVWCCSRYVATPLQSNVIPVRVESARQKQAAGCHATGDHCAPE